MPEFELKKRIEILEGEVVIGEQEGGFCSPVLMIGDVDFTEWFENKYYEPELVAVSGKFRITVEKL